MAYTLALLSRIRWGLSLITRIRWGFHATASTVLVALTVLAIQQPATSPLLNSAAAGSDARLAGTVSPTLASLAASDPGRRVEVIVQLQADAEPSALHGAIRAAGGRVTGELEVINGFAARMDAGAAQSLAENALVRAVSVNASTKRNAAGLSPGKLATAFNQAVKSSNVWSKATGKGVGVAVIDSGIAGNLPDFRVSQKDHRSRVVASAVTNPDATTAGDSYGHGTHVAGLIAGDSSNRSSNDPLHGKYAGTAPDANLISVKVSDEEGNATVLDVIYGLEFVVEHKDEFDIRVVNLSLESTDAQSYRTDPLDAAVEAAWFNGIVVVAAAGNRGTASDAVSYAPGNDPYVITVGAFDDQNTKGSGDDVLASWSSRGATQDGYSKPDLAAPGSGIVSNLAPGSAYASMCSHCTVANEYIRAGGTSMAAPIVSGVAAAILEDHPHYTPDQVKGALVHTLSSLRGGGDSVDAHNAYKEDDPQDLLSNLNLTPNELVDPATGAIDYTRSRWSRSRWSRSRWSAASNSLTAPWAESSFVCDCPDEESSDSPDEVDPTRSRWSRSRWSRSRWSRSRWSTSFVK
jgi:serine protease AprX